MMHILIYGSNKHNIVSGTILRTDFHDFLFWPFLASGSRPSFGEIFESWNKHETATVKLFPMKLK